jgi:hypothetical protein
MFTEAEDERQQKFPRLRPSPPDESHSKKQKHYRRHTHADMREQFAVPNVEGRHVLAGHADLASQYALRKLASTFVDQGVGDFSELVDETGHARIGGAHHGEPGFDAAEDRIREMLPGSRGAQEPAIIRHVHEQIGASEHELPCEFADGVLKADQGRDFAVIVR